MITEPEPGTTIHPSLVHRIENVIVQYGTALSKTEASAAVTGLSEEHQRWLTALVPSLC